jgi:hypothetical protein
MIKFFRRIRQNLLMENKTGKYLKYAIGEIILVVIGILIALQINNWNELRKQNEEEQIILSGLIEDFVETRAGFLETIRLQKRTVSQTRKLINAIEAKDYAIPADSIRKWLYLGAFSHYRLEAITGNYDALISSGKTSIIKNKTLLSNIANFASEHNLGFEDEEKSNSLIELMYSNSYDFLPALRPSSFKIRFMLYKTYTSKEKTIAVEQLYTNKAFLAQLTERLKEEDLRLIRQKNLLQFINKILSDFKVPDIIYFEENYQQYVGTYDSTTGDSTIDVTYKDGLLFFELNQRGRSFELVQFSKTSFEAVVFMGSLDFVFDKDTITALSFKFFDREEEFKKKK